MAKKQNFKKQIIHVFSTTKNIQLILSGFVLGIFSMNYIIYAWAIITMIMVITYIEKKHLEKIDTDKETQEKRISNKRLEKIEKRLENIEKLITKND
jgi:hypothetical protein